MDKHRHTVLCIDDEEIIRLTIGDYLEDSGYIIYKAKNGKEGLDIFREREPDIILVDLRMPEIDGLEVLARVTKNSPETPVIVVSGTGNIKDVIEALHLGAWDYITKPVEDMGVLEHAVERCLERARLIRENREYKENLEKLVQQKTEALLENEEHLKKLNEELEQRVIERTAELQESLETLKKTQKQLVQSEKMAALGGLVAGVAHEINTPVGVGVTAISHLEMRTQELAAKYAEGNLARSDLEQYLQTAKESSAMILTNLNRAANLIRSFKQVAVDQSVEEKRRFNLKEYLNDILLSLRPQLRKTGHHILINCPDDIEIISYPGVFSQIVSNFIMNSLIHGFEHCKKGEITLDLSVDNTSLHFKYSDNGKGMERKHLSKIFDPFFTTKRTQSGTGLGMHIVYNLITQQLHGIISCESVPGKGTTFYIDIPINR